jgi:hypothetical protein
MTTRIPTGAWQRDWISRNGGPRDASVTVRYVQTASVFGDVRIPAARAALAGASSFAELSHDQRLVLATQNGFAGYTTIDGENATWHHEIDFQPGDGSPDVGRIERVDDTRMFEHALDGSYVEAWSRLSPGDDRSFAVKVFRGNRIDQILAVAGDHFIYARACATRESILAFVDCEISHGTTRGWRIERSTLPWREGKPLAFADRIAIAPDGAPVPRDAAAGEAWSFPAHSVPTGELRALFPAPAV